MSFRCSHAFILVAVFAGSRPERNPLCLKFDNEHFCSSAAVENGKLYSNMLDSILQIPIDHSGVSSLNPLVFNESIPSSGVFSANNKLDSGSTKTLDFLSGPESIAKEGDSFFAATVDGIIKVDLKTGKNSTIYNGNNDCTAKKCSRPLGIRIRNNTLFTADLLKGLVQIDLQTGDYKTLVDIGSVIDGIKLKFPNDLDVDWENKFVYFSESSSKWLWDDWLLSVLEFENSGRIIRYDLTTGEAKTFAKGIHLANGVQISHDRKSLLVSEFSARRIREYPLNATTLPVAGNLFGGILPGNPDNIRCSASGGYWIALAVSRNNGTPTLIDELQARPQFAKKVGQWMMAGGSAFEAMGTLIGNKQLQDLGKEIKSANILGSVFPPVGAIVEVDSRGNALRYLISDKFDNLSEVLEDEESLYLGSFLNSGIVKVTKMK